ncbi:hypothetical protein EG327_004112 [Venturia inaequalis]|uniref:RINT-1 family protein n=1 Tax=Venturia inaequalis TaxID=5025 RepID=A0A8H3VDM9_VENIN|nr:hypothetical protein EG327_004112 [Venturia inaequalis]
MATTTLLHTNDRDQRVADFLDDKLQTLPDLESLDALLVKVRDQHVLLRKQLENAEIDQREAKAAAEQHAVSVQEKAELFHHAQQDIDRKLRIITQSDTSDDAVRRFEASMAKLKTLDITDAYVRQLSEVEDLSEQCRISLGKDDNAALDAYRRLHTLSSQLPALQDAAEGAAPHLVDHILAKTYNIRSEIEKAFSAQLEVVLKQMHWPTPGMTVPLALEKDFLEGVRKLLELQKPALEALQSSKDTSRAEPLVLLPLQVMARHLELAFRFHFEGDRPMNKLDRPEYFLNHVIEKFVSQYANFMDDHLQPILLEVFRGTSLSLNSAYIDATSAFITAVLPMVRAKIFAILPRSAAQLQLLSHLIHEIMSFDSTIREDWGYDAGNETEGWRGLAYEVLATDTWFSTWLKVEKDFALARYHEIIEASDNFELDYDSVGHGHTKPTKAAIQVNDLLETATDLYRTLTSFSQKLRFLIDIQISIFDLFHSRLSEGLAAYLSRTSTIGRTSREDQASLQGVAGLESLCRIYGSSEYLEKCMRDWSDDVFFLELWTELQSRASSRKTVAGSMTVAQVREATSNTVGTDDGDVSGALFDETAQSYSKLRVRCEGLITDLLTYNVRQNLTAYTRINPWATLISSSSSSISASLPPTAELDSLLTTISTHFSFLSKALGKVPLRRIARATTSTIDTILFDQVLLRHSFSSAGAAQFASDINTIKFSISKFCGAEVAEFGLLHVCEGARLVGLPVEAEEGGMGLWAVEKKMFEASGEEARGCLEELGFQRLGVAEGRKVLARRVEVSDQ